MQQYNYKSDYLPKDSQGIYESKWKDVYIMRLSQEEIDDNTQVALILHIINTVHHDAVWKLVDRMPYLGYETASIMCMQQFMGLIYHMFKINLAEAHAMLMYQYAISTKQWFDFVPLDEPDPVAFLTSKNEASLETLQLYFLNIFNVFGLELIASILDSYFESMRESLALNYQKVYRAGDVNDFDKMYPLPTSEQKIVAKETALIERICKEVIIPEIAEDLLDEKGDPSLSLFDMPIRDIVGKLIQKHYVRSKK